jgi:branched-chain amino acid transport system ATP-binding protein
MPLLSVERLRVSYGPLEVLKGVSFEVGAGEIVTMLGSNGAGKTTTLRTLAGLMKPAGGAIRFGDTDLAGLQAHEVAALGLALVPEGRQLFPEHTVEENLELGAYRRLRRGERDRFEGELNQVMDLFPRLRERRRQAAGLLSGGEQQMVAIARALVGGPRLLVLDEPSLGLSPIMVQTIFDAFAKLKARGLTILLVEQMAWAGLRICDRAYVLEAGRIALSGTRDEVIANPRVIEAYLGKTGPQTPSKEAADDSSTVRSEP